LAYFKDVELALSRVPGWQNLARSRDADCPTVLMDAVSGELVEHFAELDFTSGTTLQTFMIWPTKQLLESRRYIVAIRNLRDASGLYITPSPAFLALRDGVATSDPDVENRRSHFEQIFAFLGVRGIRRGELQLSWDFTVSSEKLTTQAMYFMRDDARSRIPATGPTYEIVSVQDNYSDRIFRKIQGVMMVPHYHTRAARPGAEMVVDANGIPVYQGEVEVPFTVAIPHKCAVEGAKCPHMVYGHGLFQTRDEVYSNSQQTFASNYGYIMAGVDMWGMAAEDVPTIMTIISTDISRVTVIPDRSHQGMLNQLVLPSLLAGPFANDSVMMFGGGSVIDTTKKYYWGCSQGGILGAVFVLLSPDIHRGQLGVPGAPYPLMLPRSVHYEPFFAILKIRYESPIDRVVLLSLLGVVWDRAEPSGYMTALARNPSKRVILDYANGDPQLTFLGTYFMARSLGARLFVNNVHCLNESTPIYGLTELDSLGPVTTGNIMIGFQYEGIGCGPVENIPPNPDTGNRFFFSFFFFMWPMLNHQHLISPDTHEGPRNDAMNHWNMDTFFKTGEIHDICDGKGCYRESQVTGL